MSLSDIRVFARADASLLFAARAGKLLSCIAVDLDPAVDWVATGSTLTGSTMQADQTLANARRQNRPMIVPTGDLPAVTSTGIPFAQLDVSPWATVLSLVPGGDFEGLLLLLSGKPSSAADAAALAVAAAQLAGLLPRAYAVAVSERRGSDAVQPRVAQKVTGYVAAPIETDHPTVPVERLDHEGLNLLLSVVRDGLVVCDVSASVLAANPPGRELLNLLQPGHRELLQHPQLLAIHRAAINGLEPEEELDVESDPRRYVRVRAASEPVPDTVLMTLRDVTDERLIHERLLQSEKMASIGQLVSGVAHELNNPLTGIMGFAQLLLMRDLPDQVKREVTTIHEEAERASRIVQNLLSFSRRRRPEKESVDVNSLIERVMELRHYELRVHNIEPRIVLEPELRPVLADPHQIQQVLLNVIGNAEQAVAEHGGGTITCMTASEGERVRIVIADDGAGIAQEHVRRVFDPFFTTKQLGEGTGLGLTISYGIIEEHGGDIALESQLGRGTTVTIDLPVAGGTQLAAPVEEITPPASALQKHSILVIDDEPSVRTLLATALSQDGHQVETVSDGARGLERLVDRDFDLIITDVKMPGVDGVEFYRRVNRWNPAVASRIIFMSGDLVSPTTRSFLDSVDNPSLAKPFRLSDIRELVASMLPR